MDKIESRLIVANDKWRTFRTCIITVEPGTLLEAIGESVAITPESDCPQLPATSSTVLTIFTRPQPSCLFYPEFHSISHLYYKFLSLVSDLWENISPGFSRSHSRALTGGTFQCCVQIVVYILLFGKRSARILEICVVYGHVYVGIRMWTVSTLIWTINVHICVHYSWQSLRWTYVWNDARLFKKIEFPKRFSLASNLSIAFYVVEFHGMSNILLCGCTKMIGAIMIINIGTNQSQGCAIGGQY